MERWEVIERWVLVAMGSVLLGLCIWLGVFQSGVERFVWVALLVPATGADPGRRLYCRRAPV